MQWLADQLKALFMWLVSLVEWAVYYIIKTLSDIAVTIVGWIFDLIPDAWLASFQTIWSGMLTYFPVIEYFFPLSFLISTIAAAVTFVIGFIAIKYLMKLIPVVG